MISPWIFHKLFIMTRENYRRQHFDWWCHNLEWRAHIKKNYTFGVPRSLSIWHNRVKQRLKSYLWQKWFLKSEIRLKNGPLPYQAKTPRYFVKSWTNKLIKLIVNLIYTKHKHISIKQTLTELRQDFWKCRGRQFVRKIIRNYFIYSKYEGPSY